MCLCCDKIYVYREGDSAFERYKYRIECKNGNEFYMIEDDEAYEHQINYCPQCGCKLEPPQEFVPVLSDKELIAELLASRDELEKKYKKLNTDLGNLWKFLLNQYKHQLECHPSRLSMGYDEFQNMIHQLEKLM